MPTFDLGILIPLLAAHLLSDFILQSDAMAQRKSNIGVLLLHLLITCLCAYILLGDFREWRLPLILAGLHGLIDLLKLSLTPRVIKEAPAFVADQAAHLAVIFALSAIDLSASGLLDPWWKSQNPLSYLQALTFFAGAIAVTQGAGLLIAKLLPNLLESKPLDLQADPGFTKAGRYIGYLERLLLLLFVMADQLAGAGFLIAAKSVFRFQKTNEDRRQTEYILVGTLLSFASGIALAFAFRHLIQAIALAPAT